MTGETADGIKNRSKLVECKKGLKFKNKGMTWLSTAHDGALRKVP